MMTRNPQLTNHSFKTLLGVAICNALVTLISPSATAQTINPGILDPTNTFEGKSYGDWSAAHWQWLYSLPVDKNPLFDTADVSVGQMGDVWFLGGTYTTTTDTNGVTYGTAVRDCVIPQGISLFFPLIDAESSIAEGNGTNYAELLANSQDIINGADNLSCTIDGQTMQGLTNYRASSDLFTWGPLPTNNVFGDPINFPAGTTSQAVSDGYFLLVQPLSPGDHSIHFTGGVPGFQLDITYNITVTPTNGVYPPGSTMFGKTYSEWSGAFFQYYFSRPATNNPFWYESVYPHVPLGIGQSGPVWFVHGYRNTNGTFTRNDIIPGGTSLLIVAVDLDADNTACPTPINDTPAELLGLVTNYVNGATNMAVKVDGVSVADISDSRTTPFRVQTIYNYTAPASNNMIDISEDEPCYQNTHGIPYNVTNAVGDGVVLMVPPLSPGSHTINYQLRILPNPTFNWNMTENITVLPITPALTVSNQSGTLQLSWPQNATNFTVETTSSLNPPNWRPANLPVTALEGIYRVSAPVGTNSQFFRLRQH